MAIFFEENILFPKDYKVDHIKISDELTIHYKISSSIDNSRWHISITLEQNGNVIPRYDLSKFKKTYGELQSYIEQIPRIIKDKESEQTLDNQMTKDLNHIIYRLQLDIDLLKEWQRRYNI